MFSESTLDLLYFQGELRNVRGGGVVVKEFFLGWGWLRNFLGGVEKFQGGCWDFFGRGLKFFGMLRNFFLGGGVVEKFSGGGGAG